MVLFLLRNEYLSFAHRWNVCKRLCPRLRGEQNFTKKKKKNLNLENNIVSSSTFVLHKGDRHWFRRKDGCCVCLCVSSLQGIGGVCLCSLAFCEKLNCSFQNKRASLCTNTTGGGFPFSRALLKRFKQPPNTRRHSYSHTQIVSLSLCLSPPHSQTNRAKFSRDRKLQSSTQQKQTLWTPTARQEKNGAEKKGSLSLRGVKLFLCYGLGWPCEDSDTLLCKERQRACALLAGVTLTSNTPDRESRFLSPLSPAGPCAHSL